MTKNELKIRVWYWANAYKEVILKHYDLTDSKEKANYERTCESTDEAREQIEIMLEQS